MRRVRILAVVALAVAAVFVSAETRLMTDVAKVQKFVDKAAFKISATQLEGKGVFHLATICIDGRRLRGEKGLLPELAIPGADAGNIAAVLGMCNRLELSLDTKEKMVEWYIKLRGGIQNLRFHTDTHHERDATGCGHFRLSKENPAEYGLTMADVGLIEAILQKIGDRGMQVLVGEHLEAAVLVNKIGNVGIQHQVDDEQVFVYDKVRHQQMLMALAADFAVEFSLELDTLQLGSLQPTLLQVAEKQLSATVQHLALEKGLRVFSVERGKAGRLSVSEVRQ